MVKEFIMDLVDALNFINKHGIPTARYWVVSKLGDLDKVKADLTFPLVVKISSREVVHKSDLGGVVTDIRTYDELKRTIKMLEERFSHVSDKKWLLQEMVRGDIELIAGGLRDEVFGPVVMFGLGGVFTEVYGDVTFRLTPLTIDDAYNMISSIKARVLLDGYRGIPPINKEKIVSILLKVSEIMSSYEEIKEIDINPIICKGDMVKAVDARIVLSKGY